MESKVDAVDVDLNIEDYELFVKGIHDLVNRDKIEDFVSSVTETLTDSEIPNHDKRKVSTLETLLCITRAPCAEFVFDASANDFIDTLLSNERFDYKSLFSQSDKNIIQFSWAVLEIDLNFDIKNKILANVINHFISMKSLESAEFLRELWRRRTSVGLSFGNMEFLAVKVPACVEETLITLCQKTVSCERMEFSFDIACKDMVSLVNLCSKSAPFFKTVLRIFHELLLLSKAHSKILSMVHGFVSKVIAQSEDGILMFPAELRLLAVMMNIDPDVYPKYDADKNFKISAVLDALNDLMTYDKHTAIALISYFPKWLQPTLKCCNTEFSFERYYWLQLMYAV